MAIENKYCFNDSSSLLPDFRYKGKSDIDLSKILEKAKKVRNSNPSYEYDTNLIFFDKFLEYDKSVDYFKHSFLPLENIFESPLYKNGVYREHHHYGYYGFYPKFTNDYLKFEVYMTNWSSYDTTEYKKLEGNSFYKFVHNNRNSNDCWKNYHYFLVKKIDSDPNKIGIYDAGKYSNTEGITSNNDIHMPELPFQTLQEATIISEVTEINDKNVINLFIVAAGGSGGKSAYSYETTGGGGGSGAALLLSLDLSELKTVYDAFYIAIGPKGKGTQYYKIEYNSDEITYTATIGYPCFVTKINMNASNMYNDYKYVIPGGTYGMYGWTKPSSSQNQFPPFLVSPSGNIIGLNEPPAENSPQTREPPVWGCPLADMDGLRGSFSANGKNPRFITENNGLHFNHAKTLFDNDLSKDYQLQSRSKTINPKLIAAEADDSSYYVKYTTGAPGFCSSGGKAYLDGNPHIDPSNHIYKYTGTPATGYGAGGGGGFEGKEGHGYNLGGDGGPAAMFIYY